MGFKQDPTHLFTPFHATKLYLGVGTVNECTFGQQVSEEMWQVSGQRCGAQNLSDPTRHINHGLMREAHIQSSVSSFYPGTKDRKDGNVRLNAENGQANNRENNMSS